MVRALALIVFVVAVFASYHQNASKANALEAADRTQCERGNAVRRALDVLIESQLADLRAASELASNPGLRAQYSALLAKTEAVVGDPINESLLEIVDCDSL